MMHQNTPFRDFDELETAPSGGRITWIVGILLFAILLVAALSVGYGLGRGTWTVPSAVFGHPPAVLAHWLPRGGASLEAGAQAVLKDYAFELVGTEVKQGEAVLAVRLMHKPTGKPVPDAVIFARRLDMAPEGMPTMTTPLETGRAQEPGVYQFKANLKMEGDWQLSLGAKVQGEIGTVQNKLVLKAIP